MKRILQRIVANESRKTRHIVHATIKYASYVHVQVEERADVKDFFIGDKKILWQFVDRINGGRSTEWRTRLAKKRCS